ncbi:hypothetical protein CYMTET_5044 [Cymbomonas tetramitiformis]|uniref:Uncharacterized protein n=1 Tax=Cymbomonas tetramitiformis TaxID=36881 RepID=A0AAE0LJA6_9CHLO|nr:hypothetical protein CYMTET_5044 [Cymbomonas tetramitiformis]
MKLVVVIGFSLQHDQHHQDEMQREFSTGIRRNATAELKQIVRLAHQAPPGGYPTSETEKLRYACEKLEEFEMQLSDLLNIVAEQSTNQLEGQEGWGGGEKSRGWWERYKQVTEEYNKVKHRRRKAREGRWREEAGREDSEGMTGEAEGNTKERWKEEVGGKTEKA